MTYFDYKAVPAPRRMKKIKGVKSPEDLFAHTLTEAINEHARQGWEYLRSESLTAETPGGWLRRGSTDTQTVLVFRRSRETLGPRLAATDGGAVDWKAETRPEPAVDTRRTPPADDDPRIAAHRHEPALTPPAAEPAPALEDHPPQTPLRPGPRLGPADRS